MTHYNTKFRKRTFPIVLVCEKISNASNLGSIFRTAEAFGIEKLIISKDSASINGKMKRSSRATENHVNYEISNHIEAVIIGHKENGYHIIALEITEQSRPLSELKIGINQKVLIIIGNESTGVSGHLLSLADETVHIEMFGKNSSMNIGSATSVALYEIVRQIG